MRSRTPRPPVSIVRVRTPRGIALVRVPPEIDQALDLESLGVEVSRVRHVLPACQRIGIVKPALVVVGAGARSDDVVVLAKICSDIDAEMIEIDARADIDEVRRWIAARIHSEHPRLRLPSAKD